MTQPVTFLSTHGVRQPVLAQPFLSYSQTLQGRVAGVCLALVLLPNSRVLAQATREAQHRPATGTARVPVVRHSRRGAFNTLRVSNPGTPAPTAAGARLGVPGRRWRARPMQPQGNAGRTDLLVVSARGNTADASVSRVAAAPEPRPNALTGIQPGRVEPVLPLACSRSSTATEHRSHEPRTGIRDGMTSQGNADAPFVCLTASITRC